MKTTHIRLIILLMMSSNLILAQKPSIIPEPAIWENKRGNFSFSGNTDLFVPKGDDQMMSNANFLKMYLERIPNVNIQIRYYQQGQDLPARGIVLAVDPRSNTPERYVMGVTSRRILITGDDFRGVFYGIQSLRQLLPAELEQPALASQLRNVRVSNIYIEDYPRFPYRGMHLDVARHFFDVDFIKKYIDLMVLHKMNTFHWHLTEDQGWRIEIKKYPLLTEIGAWRKETLIGHGGRPPFEYDGKRYGGYYTQDDVREIVAYAADRHITVIPEIEMPGHATAALAAYPHLGCTGGPYEVITRWGVFEDVFCAGNDDVFEFLENVLLEVIELFPSQYIHIGGDECPKTRWKECPKCQARIQEEGLADEYELQSYFIRRIEKFLLSKGRNIIGWDEILEGGLAPEATVMSWRGVRGGIEAAQMGHDVIMTPTSHCYFDYYQADPESQPLGIGGYLPLSRVYEFNPNPLDLTEEQAKHILGGQGNVWTEYMKTSDHVEYMAYPRAIALAEVLWTPNRKHDFDDFTQRLNHHFKRLDALGVNYFRE
ncbi:MAG: beta-N-acetylhexosaminidase [Bacteroidales bacterium]|nr:beta-N-acetylhexosaminidase [Bacteroidales bacterium]